MTTDNRTPDRYTQHGQTQVNEGALEDFARTLPKHTPTPWYATQGIDDTVWVGPPGGGRMPVAECPKTHGESYATISKSLPERMANGRFIALACSAHEDMLAALRDADAQVPGWRLAVAKAIAKATGGQP